ncbi:MAG: HEPN domain-containing protein [Caldilineae bacterium]|nr:MAG: HEPN domain-containing protein [Caldilineae bacterium]
MLTAEEDLQAANILLKEKMYAQACFLAQQSGEKGLKALWYLIDANPWGHSIQRLVMEFPQKETFPSLEKWLEQGAMLDKFYIPTHYPNGLPDLTPGQVYGLTDAKQAVETARTLLAQCKKWLGEYDG